MGRWAPLGIAIAATTVVALMLLESASAPPAAAIAGLALLAVGAGIAPRRRLAVGMVLAAPGAALVGFGGGLDHPDWMRFAGAASITIAAPLVADADTRWSRLGGAPIALAIAAAGMAACVPDVEEARVLLAVAIVAAMLSRAPRLRILGTAGAAASAGLFVWSAAFDARGRPSAFVGAVATLGLLAWEPLGVWVRGWRTPRVRGAAAVLGAFVSHVVLVGYASRVVGLERSTTTALALAAPAALAGIAFGLLAGAPPRNRAMRRSTP